MDAELQKQHENSSENATINSAKTHDFVEKGRRGFLPGKSGNPKGRPKGGFSAAEKLRDLIGEQTISDAIKADFLAGVEKVRVFVYEHTYGKPVLKTESEIKNLFPEGGCILSFGAKQAITEAVETEEQERDKYAD